MLRKRNIISIILFWVILMAGETIQIYNNGNMMHDFDFKPSTSIDEELGKFVTWFKEYYRYE